MELIFFAFSASEFKSLREPVQARNFNFRALQPSWLLSSKSARKNYSESSPFIGKGLGSEGGEGERGESGAR